MKIILISLLSFNLFASRPTPESLFRNNNNPEIKLSTVRAKLVIEEIPEELTVEEVDSDKTKPLKTFAKLYAFQNDERFNFLQVLYSDSKMSDSDIIQTYYRTNFLSFLQFKKETEVDRDLLYGILTSLLLNDSSVIAGLLRKTQPLFRSNRQILNQEKIGLLEDYSNYLKRIKDDPKLKEELESPLEPKDVAKKQQADKILSSSAYRRSEQVKLRNENGRFFWEVELDSFKAKFTNEKRRLVSLTMDSGEGSLEMHFGDYLVFNGVHELPKHIFFKTSSGNKYHLTFTELRHMNLKPKSFRRARDRYLKLPKAKDQEYPSFFF